MPALFCLPESAAPAPGWSEAFLEELISLREAGEPIALWSERPVAPHPRLQAVESAAELDEVMEDERIPMVISSALPPEWLRLGDFDRILLICAEAGEECGNYLPREWPGWARLMPERRELIEHLLAQEGESVDLVRGEDALDLNQSWCSGRRIGVRLLAGESGGLQG